MYTNIHETQEVWGAWLWLLWHKFSGTVHILDALERKVAINEWSNLVTCSKSSPPCFFAGPVVVFLLLQTQNPQALIQWMFETPVLFRLWIMILLYPPSLVFRILERSPPKFTEEWITGKRNTETTYVVPLAATFEQPSFQSILSCWTLGNQMGLQNHYHNP